MENVCKLGDTVLADTSFEDERTSNVSTRNGRQVRPPEGGLVHCRAAKMLVSAGVKAEPSGRPTADLDTGLSFPMIAFSVMRVFKRVGGQQHRTSRSVI